MRLLRVELSRFRARVLLWCIAVGLVLTSAVVVFSAWQDSAPPSAAAVAEAHTYFDRDAEAWKTDGPAQIADCKQQQADMLADDPDMEPWDCDDMAPRLENYLPYQPTLPDDGVRSIQGLGIAVVLAAGLMAVSFVAAEFSTGAISNWLTFAPRRGRVFWSKLVAALVGVLPVALLTVAIGAGGVVLAFRSHGLTDALTDAEWRRVLDTSLRLLVLAPVAAAAGVALAFLLRHTAAVLGAAVGWAVVWEGVILSMVAQWRPYSLIFDIQAWVAGGATYGIEDCSVRDEAGITSCQWIEKTVGMTQAGVQLSVVVVLLVVVALVVFRRRDVA